MLHLSNQVYPNPMSNEYVALDVENRGETAEVHKSEDIEACRSVPDVDDEEALLLTRREKSRTILKESIIRDGMTDVSYFKETVAQHVSKYGDAHRLTIECYFLYGKALKATGRNHQAKKILLFVVERCRTVLGVSELETLEAMKVLGELHLLLYDHKEAETILTECRGHCVERFGDDGQLTVEVFSLLQAVQRRRHPFCVLFWLNLRDYFVLEFLSDIRREWFPYEKLAGLHIVMRVLLLPVVVGYGLVVLAVLSLVAAVFGSPIFFVTVFELVPLLFRPCSCCHTDSEAFVVVDSACSDPAARDKGRKYFGFLICCGLVAGCIYGIVLAAA